MVIQKTGVSAFYRAVIVCRYCLYLFVTGLSVWAGWPVSVELSYPTMAFLALSLVVHAGLSFTPGFRVQQLIYFVEWIAVCVYLSWGPVPLFAVLCCVLVILAGHTALWGWRYLLCSFSIGLFIAVCVSMPSFPQPGFVALNKLEFINVIAAAACALLIIVVCGIAHSRVIQLLRQGASLQRDNHHLLRYLPQGLGQLYSDGAPKQPQRLWMTVCFIDMAGFTEATQKLPIEHLTELLNDFLNHTQDLVSQWDGLVAKFLGDGVLCVFLEPAPPSSISRRTNCAVQATRCMRQIAAPASGAVNTEYSIELNIGMATGYCYLGDWGRGARLDHTVIGAPVNLACRLQSVAADYGGLLLDETTYALVNGVEAGFAPQQFEFRGIGWVTAFAQQAFDARQTVGCNGELC